MQTTEAVVAIMGMVVSFGLPLLLVAIILYYKHRKLRMTHATIAALAEKGLPVPPELLDPPRGALLDLALPHRLQRLAERGAQAPRGAARPRRRWPAGARALRGDARHRGARGSRARDGGAERRGACGDRCVLLRRPVARGSGEGARHAARDRQDARIAGESQAQGSAREGENTMKAPTPIDKLDRLLRHDA